MDYDDDWDLHAVVRGCASTVPSAASTTTTATNNPSFAILPSPPPQNSLDFLTDDVSNDHFQGLQEVYQELCGGSPPPPTASVPAAHNAYQRQIEQIKSPPQQTMNDNVQSQENIQFSNPRIASSSTSHNFPGTNPQPIRQRRRKNQQMKIVRQMTQEELSADSWAWRKYGQKPIKGSPYPRNYYRCSTSKGCAARKQVERSPNDANIFVVSYSGEHTHPRPTHRSSLSGSTRSKLSSPPNAAVKISNNDNNSDQLLSQTNKGLNNISSPPPAASLSSTAATPLAAAPENDDLEMAEECGGGDDDEEEEENIFMVPNDLMNDNEDLFKGFHDCDDHDGSGGSGDLFPGGLISSPPWTPTSAAAFHGGGGGG